MGLHPAKNSSSFAGGRRDGRSLFLFRSHLDRLFQRLHLAEPIEFIMPPFRVMVFDGFHQRVYGIGHV
jgi:hypothetical protein